MKIKWYIKILLYFVREHYSIDETWLEPGFYVRYKSLFGKLYILGKGLRPPEHINCRCIVNPSGVAGNK